LTVAIVGEVATDGELKYIVLIAKNGVTQKKWCNSEKMV